MGIEDKVRATVAQYLERFSAGDREGWLDLFADDATMEDPVGTEVRVGREAIGAFWDQSVAMADSITLQMVQGPGVRGNEAAWAMEAHVTLGKDTFIAPTIDVMTFADDGRITSMRAYYGQNDSYEA
jgi:steroid delta-isomerase